MQSSSLVLSSFLSLNPFQGSVLKRFSCGHHSVSINMSGLHRQLGCVCLDLFLEQNHSCSTLWFLNRGSSQEETPGPDETVLMQAEPRLCHSSTSVFLWCWFLPGGNRTQDPVVLRNHLNTLMTAGSRSNQKTWSLQQTPQDW